MFFSPTLDSVSKKVRLMYEICQDKHAQGRSQSSQRQLNKVPAYLCSGFYFWRRPRQAQGSAIDICVPMIPGEYRYRRAVYSLRGVVLHFEEESSCEQRVLCTSVCVKISRVHIMYFVLRVYHIVCRVNTSTPT